jgi:hypothetical protein
LSRFDHEDQFLDNGPDSSEKKILRKADVSQEFYDEYMKILKTSKKDKNTTGKKNLRVKRGKVSKFSNNQTPERKPRSA